MSYAIPPSQTGSDTGLPSNVGAGLCAVFHIFGGIIFGGLMGQVCLDLFIFGCGRVRGCPWVFAAIVTQLVTQPLTLSS